MNPDPDLERLEERVREAFPACEHPPILIEKGKLKALPPIFPEATSALWDREYISKHPFQVPARILPMPTEVDYD